MIAPWDKPLSTKKASLRIYRTRLKPSYSPQPPVGLNFDHTASHRAAGGSRNRFGTAVCTQQQLWRPRICLHAIPTYGDGSLQGGLLPFPARLAGLRGTLEELCDQWGCLTGGNRPPGSSTGQDTRGRGRGRPPGPCRAPHTTRGPR